MLLYDFAYFRTSGQIHCVL